MYVAYYLHWPLSEILDLEHRARIRVIEEIGTIHQQLSLDRSAGGRPGQP